MSKVFLSLQEVRELTGLGEFSLAQIIKSGDLKSVKVGRRRLVKPEWLTEFADRVAA